MVRCCSRSREDGAMQDKATQHIWHDGREEDEVGKGSGGASGVYEASIQAIPI